MTEEEFLAATMWAYHLGRNLAVAGALCRSYEIANDGYGDGYWGEEYWHPGCGYIVRS